MCGMRLRDLAGPHAKRRIGVAFLNKWQSALDGLMGLGLRAARSGLSAASQVTAEKTFGAHSASKAFSGSAANGARDARRHGLERCCQYLSATAPWSARGAVQER